MAGATQILNEALSTVAQDAVDEEDLEETEAHYNGIELDAVVDARLSAGQDDDVPGSGEDTHEAKRQKVQTNGANSETTEILFDRLRVVSKNVVTPQTLDDCARLWKQFVEFCIEMQWFKTEHEMSKDLPALDPNMPMYICVWIMSKGTDAMNWTHSQAKMRSAMTRKWGRELDCGTSPWIDQPTIAGKSLGNPSMSTTVAQYIVSLGRRKVRAGYAPISARAMCEQTVKNLHKFNADLRKLPENITFSNKRKMEQPEEWAGFHVRMMLQLLYTVSNLDAPPLEPASRTFHKTRQNGGILPFYLYLNDDKPWMYELGLDYKAYIFRKQVVRDRISSNSVDAMTLEAVLECFRNNISLTLVLILDPTAPILSVAAAVSTSPWLNVGRFATSAREEVGLRTSTIQAPSSSTCFLSTITPSFTGLTISTAIALAEFYVLIAFGLAVVLKTRISLAFMYCIYVFPSSNILR
ncbi:hypothetical protein EIP91_007808 [Steccherinum ochraceum]|uniref:Uncharacterized protein n=1 Tax=Steccherinum ochraceum TaxID=92696 RepID=A0A4R0R3S1_9APHY|nr:hypothetical protein EIP91_007808 [Steccherinum ochraceum]